MRLKENFSLVDGETIKMSQGLFFCGQKITGKKIKTFILKEPSNVLFQENWRRFTMDRYRLQPSLLLIEDVMEPS